VAQVFDLAGVLRRAALSLSKGRESEMLAPSGFDHVSTTKSNSTRSIATHPCKKRKDDGKNNQSAP